MMDCSDWQIPDGLDIRHKKHVQFFARMLDGLPASYSSQETNLLTLIYFCVSGLDLLDATDQLNKRRTSVIEFVYTLQSEDEIGGFFGNPNDANHNRSLKTKSSEPGNGLVVGTSIAMTFAALATLVILGDDLSRVRRRGIIKQLQVLQAENGSFHGVVPLHSSSDSVKLIPESESDMRFVYCAAVISFILWDWSGIDVHKMQNFIWSSRTYEGGFAQVPGAECHGGSTFCAVAALYLISLSKKLSFLQASTCDHCEETLKVLFDPSSDPESSSYIRDDLIRWCLFRQKNGFNGRPNKPEDSCYTFWIGAALKLVNAYEFVDEKLLQEFCLETQDAIIGGFSKWPDTRPDPLHSYLCLSGLSLMQRRSIKKPKFSAESIGVEIEEEEKSRDKLKPIHPALNISISASVNLSNLKQK